MMGAIRSDLRLAGLLIVPSLAGIVGGHWIEGIALGSSVAMPINLAAALVGVVAMRGSAAIGFAGILAALLVRIVGIATAAVAIHAVVPTRLSTALSCICVLLLTGLAIEAWWHFRTPSSTGSPRV